MEPQIIELTGSGATGITNGNFKAAANLPTRVCLGRVKPKAHPACLKLSSYVDADAVAGALPVSINRRDKAAASLSRMYVNDQLGCCVFSGKFHNMGLWSANDSDSGGEVFATDQEVRSQYLKYTGGRDVGSNIAEVLDIFRSRGMTAGGKQYKIDGYVSVDWRNKDLVKVGQLIFGATSIGFDLPNEWRNTAVWDVTNSGTVGGHDVSPIDYDERGVYVSSWGRIYLMTWAAFMSTRWISEMYAMLAPLWYNADGIAPTGMKVDKLQTDLAKIGGGIIPEVEPPPAPIPTPEFPYQIALANDLPAGPCTISSNGVTIQANVSTGRKAGTYLLTTADPLPPG